ncbi:BRCA1-A complex subunit RAP80 [Labeo rohita]|uniref:BRCA1-A complex subunit RAP80 n=1 Tax=Labeo rohita TaxID=84645 RepID=A0ABQ8LKH2_LABRO|nr:BRCA1-A complex subunit RAP80 [Labeo rohita]
MPRRKRTSDEGGRRAKVSRVEHNEETLVISDSEHEEPGGDEGRMSLIYEESTVKASEDQDEAASSSNQPQQNVTNPMLRRRKLSYHSQDQTHSDNEREPTSPLPEMPDLSQTTSSHLSTTGSPAQVSSPPAATQDKASDKQTVVSNTPELFRSISESQSQTSPAFTRHGSLIRQPVVCVEKLSQDLILASRDSNFHTQDSAAASICVDRSPSPKQEDSPFSKCPVFTQNNLKTDLLEDKDGRKNANASEDYTQISGEDTNLPTQKTTKLKQVEDQTTRGENVKSDKDDDEDDGSEEALPPSPVLCKEKIFKPIKTELSPTQSCTSPATVTLCPSIQDTQMSQSVLEEDLKASKVVEFKSSDCKPPHTSVKKEECTVSYYWGVPFCPMGQNPDEYTRVILCQMEVYEKSLKEAQRELLRKVDWGQPVCPSTSERPFGARRWKRHRAPQLSEDEEENEEEGEKENNRIDVEEEKVEAKEGSVVGSQEDAEGRQSETYVVLSSPETKDDQVEKSPYFSQEEPVTATLNKPFRKNAPWDISGETQIQCSAEQEEEEAQNHEHCEEDEIICPETQMTQTSTPELMVTSPAQPQSRADSEVMEVEEGGGAPAMEEEMMEQESGPAEAASLHNQRMECPMCSKFFPLHRIEENGLLSALDRKERRHTGTDEPGPSDVSTTSNCGLADPAVMGSSQSVDCTAMTSCPRNTFTPQSENTDCLIDSSKNSQRLSRKRKYKK